MEIRLAPCIFVGVRLASVIPSPEPHSSGSCLALGLPFLKEERKLIDSSPCCLLVLVEHWQNEVCSRRGMEIEQWNCWSMCVLAHIGGQAHL